MFANTHTHTLMHACDGSTAIVCSFSHTSQESITPIKQNFNQLLHLAVRTNPVLAVRVGTLSQYYQHEERPATRL